MNLQTLLGDVPIQQFVADFYHRLPYSAAGLAAPLCELGTWKSLTAIIGQDNADVLVCRRNEQFAGPLPRTADHAMRLIDDGYTLLVRHAERHDARLAEVSAAFARDFASPVNIHMYCTPGGQFGFGWQSHSAVEVFDFLRSQILESIFWRQRLPVTGAAAGVSDTELREQYAAAFRQFGQELTKLLADPRQVDAFLQQLRAIRSAPQSAAEAERVAPTS